MFKMDGVIVLFKVQYDSALLLQLLDISVLKLQDGITNWLSTVLQTVLIIQHSH